MQEHEIKISARLAAIEEVVASALALVFERAGVPEEDIQGMYRKLNAKAENVTLRGYVPVESDHVAGEFQESVRYLAVAIEASRQALRRS